MLAGNANSDANVILILMLFNLNIGYVDVVVVFVSEFCPCFVKHPLHNV